MLVADEVRKIANSCRLDVIAKCLREVDEKISDAANQGKCSIVQIFMPDEVLQSLCDRGFKVERFDNATHVIRWDKETSK